MASIDRKTITDFGEQWQEFRRNTGYYASMDMFRDIVGPLVSTDEIKDSVVADIGSGTGRVVNMLAEAGAESIVAVEPSTSFSILKENTSRYNNRITYLNICGHELTYSDHFDYIFTFGVLHHIQDPLPCLRACYRSLKPGGRIVVWVYGFEGNEVYLRLYNAVCSVTKALPHWALSGICRLLYLPVIIYGKLSVILRLPMHEYFSDHFFLLDRTARIVTLYDQLNPAFAKYYREEEAIGTLESAGFRNIRTYHRHGYSWTLIGTKP